MEYAAAGKGDRRRRQIGGERIGTRAWRRRVIRGEAGGREAWRGRCRAKDGIVGDIAGGGYELSAKGYKSVAYEQRSAVRIEASDLYQG